MIKTLTLAVSLTVSSLSLYAQDLKINWGTEFDSKTEIQKIIGFADDKMVAYSTKGKDRFIETYSDDDMKLLNTTEYELPEIKGEQSGLLNVTLSGNRVSMLLYVYKKKTRSFNLYSHTLDLNGKAVGEPKEIYDSGETDAKMKDASVNVTFSPDGSKALVYFDRKDSDRLTFYSDNLVLDLTSELAVVSENKLDFEIRKEKSEKIVFRAYHSVQNDGSFGLIREKLETKGFKILDFGLEVGRYTNEGELIGEAEVAKDGMILMSPTIVMDGDKTRMVGYYMNNEKGSSFVSGYSGLFVAEFDGSMGIEYIKTNEFSNEFLRNVYSDGKVDRMDKKGKELRVPAPYTMNEIFVHSDGSMTVLSEFYQVVVQSNKGQTTTTTTYGSILYFKLNTEGELTASDAIKKLQASSTSSIGLGIGGGGLGMFASIELPDKKLKYWSYASTMNDDNIYIVFNDHFKNQGDDEDDISKALVNPTKSVPYLATIDPEGGFTKEAMVDSGDTETYLVPQVTHDLGESQFVIWGIWKKANKFGIATID